MDVSVVICAHNSRPTYLRRVLSSLQAQDLPKQRWELILVDNLSRVPLAGLDLSWHPHARHILEEKLGLTWARERGVREAIGDLIVFVDDDNVLVQNYLSEAVRIGCEWPRLGAWGSGSTIPEYEEPPDGGLTELLPYLTLREVPTARWSNMPDCAAAIPYGAGLCVRAKIATIWLDFQRAAVRLSGRSGQDPLSGEDIEISWVACNAGFGVGIFPELRLTHLIRKERIAEDYLISLYEGTRFSNHLLAYKWRGVVPRDPLSCLGLLSIVRNLLLLRGLHRRMFLAATRAAMKARSNIASHQCKS